MSRFRAGFMGEEAKGVDWDVIVIGAGASGLMCAAQCAGRGRRVAVLDHARACGRKVRISGGGRCNAANLQASAGAYVCANPHFVKSALARYTPRDFLDFLTRRKVSFNDEGQGRIFARAADDVAEALRLEALERGATLLLETVVQGVRREGGRFRVDAGGGPLGASAVVVAAGGLSWPQIGATNLGFRIAESFGLSITALRPGLVPLLAPDDLKGLCASLAGISLNVRIADAAGRYGAEGGMLFTHQGLSGPAVLDASLSWREGQCLALDLLPGVDLAEALGRKPRMDLHNGLGLLLPKRLAWALCERQGWAGTFASLSQRQAAAMAELLHAFPFAPAATAGFGKAEVTLGGVETSQLSSKTMECRSVPGLFFTGEVLDVTGRLGGYNLQWAWSSGFAAGQYA